MLMFTLKTHKHLFIVRIFNMYARVHIIFSGGTSIACQTITLHPL